MKLEVQAVFVRGCSSPRFQLGAIRVEASGSANETLRVCKPTGVGCEGFRRKAWC